MLSQLGRGKRGVIQEGWGGRLTSEERGHNVPSPAVSPEGRSVRKNLWGQVALGSQLNRFVYSETPRSL